MIVGCIYRHPTSKVAVEQFNQDYIEPMLDKVTSEDKLCAIMGDFNIDLLKSDHNDDANTFFNNFTSSFFTPYILQPTRLASKTLIDHIFINTIEYPSYSGNITIQLSDHFFQFTILEGFFKELVPKHINLFERNFKKFNETKFNEALSKIEWNNILLLEMNDPNLSMNNFHQHINTLLDEYAPYRKITKKEYKLKSRPWITKEIQVLMDKRDKLLHKFNKLKNKEADSALNLYNEYKRLRNILTLKKRVSKKDYYTHYLVSIRTRFP